MEIQNSPEVNPLPDPRGPGAGQSSASGDWRLLLQRSPALAPDISIFPITGHVRLNYNTFKWQIYPFRPIMELLGSSETGGPMTAGLKGPGMR